MLWLKLSTLATWCEELTHLKRPWCWERLKAGGEEDDRGWHDWVVSPTQWTWVWVDSGSWWWTGRPGVLLFMGLQSRTWLNWTELELETPMDIHNQETPFTKMSLMGSVNRIFVYTFVVAQSLSCVLLLETPWTATRQVSPSINLPEFAQVHVHWIGDNI